MEKEELTLTEVMDIMLTYERSEEEYTDELIDVCTTLLMKIQDERLDLLSLAYDTSAPEKVTRYAEDAVDILHDCAERIYDLKRNMEESR